MRRRLYSHLLLANNDVIIPPRAVPLLLQQLQTAYDLIVPMSSRHGSGFGSETCCVCPSGVVSARSWAVAAAEHPLCAAVIQRWLGGGQAASFGSLWMDHESGTNAIGVVRFVRCFCFSSALLLYCNTFPLLIRCSVPPVVALPDSFLGYFLAINRSALQYAFPSSGGSLSFHAFCRRYAHADGQFFDPANVIFGQEGALRDAIDRGGGTWGISTRAFVFHFKGATVHRRRLSLWSNEPPSKTSSTAVRGEEASDNVRCRLRQVRWRFADRSVFILQLRSPLIPLCSWPLVSRWTLGAMA